MMKNTSWMTRLALLTFTLGTFAARAAENYADTLRAGDDLRAQGNFIQAMAEYDSAAMQAGNDTERALAIGKKGYVLAYDLKDYAQALSAAQDALRTPGVESVAKVTALQVLAECQMKDGKNYADAVTTLQEALALEGVDWAKPALTLALGDSLRFSGRFQEALSAFESVEQLAANDAALKAVACLNQGLTYQYSLQDFNKARAAYSKASGLNPGLKEEIAGHLGKLP